jgi:hypothetical protein
VLKSSRPLELGETELVTVHGEKGLLVNKSDIATWRGELPLSEYKLNEDPNPEVIRKQSDQTIVFTKEVAIRYLRPPTPPPPGEIFIKQERNIQIAPAPPVVMRQVPARPATPEPIVIREAPPKPPAALGGKVITVSGRKLAPPPRKVIIERLPPMPPPPQSVIIERWLAYPELKRKVIFQKSAEADVVFPQPKNVIIQWEPPTAEVRTEFRDLGVIRANPADYVARYGPTLKQPNELPDFVKQIKAPPGIILAAEYYAKAVHELEGDVQALNMIDLEREGLAEYQSFVESHRAGRYIQPSYVSTNAAHEPVRYTTTSEQCKYPQGGAGAESWPYDYSSGGYPYEQGQKSYYQEALHPTTYAAAVKTQPTQRNVDAVLQDVFNLIDNDADGFVTIDDVRRIFLPLNSRLNKSYGEDDAQAFIGALDKNKEAKCAVL